MGEFYAQTKYSNTSMLQFTQINIREDGVPFSFSSLSTADWYNAHHWENNCGLVVNMCEGEPLWG